jgi:hypothetical protein
VEPVAVEMGRAVRYRNGLELPEMSRAGLSKEKKPSKGPVKGTVTRIGVVEVPKGREWSDPAAHVADDEPDTKLLRH